MTAAAAERMLLDEIEPYVLMAASTLITCAYNGNYAAFDLLSRPHVFRAQAIGGQVAFELPEWLPAEEALLGVGETGLHSIVKHLNVQRAVSEGKPGTRIHRLQLGPALCKEGESATLTYSPWFRFAAPPYRFDVERQAAAYVVTALAHLCQARGQSVHMDVAPDLSVLWLSERLRIEAMGDTTLTDITVMWAEDESHLSLPNPQLSLSRRMFPDVYAAARSAAEAGEAFRGASMLIDEERLVLSGDQGARDVQA